MNTKGKIARIIILITVPLWLVPYLIITLINIAWEEITEYLEGKEWS